MRQPARFRPQVVEVLESRAVPSTLSVSTPTGVLGISVDLPRQVPVDSPRVQAAFAAFDQSYIRAVDDVLLAPGPGGLVVPSANRAAFDVAVEQSLVTLAEQLVLSLGTTPAGSSAANQVVDAIVGAGPNSLESRLEALPTTAIGLTAPLVTSTAGASNPSPLPTVVDTAERVRPTHRVPVAESATTDASAAYPTSTASSSASSKAAEDVRSAFNNFLNDYFKAVQGVLLAPAEGGQVDPKAHRADFDARVDQALRSLDARLAATLARDPATSALGPRVRAAIEGDGPGSLKAQLANLATPRGPQASIVRDFTLGSTRAIAGALSLISGDVARLLGPAGH